MAENKRIPGQNLRMKLGFIGLAVALPALIFGAGVWIQAITPDTFAAIPTSVVPQSLGASQLAQSVVDEVGVPPASPPIPSPPAPTVKRQSDDLLALTSWFGRYQVASLSELIAPIQSGDTVLHYLQRMGADRMDAFNAVAALTKIWNPRDIRPGLDVTVVNGKLQGYDSRQFAGFFFRPSVGKSVVVYRNRDDSFSARVIQQELQRDVAYGGNIINSSLFQAGSDAGVPVSVLVEMIRSYSYNVDFQRDLHQGDSFEVLYDAWRDDTGTLARTGDLQYAALTVQGKKREIFAFTRADGTREFFDRNGESIRRALLRTPIDGARMSSGFGMRRHPILGFSKMHQGVDFAAPTGTPVRAAGDGVVMKVGAFGSFGNYLLIRHNESYSTAYAHLSGFRKGIRVGTPIKQGDVVAYVGTTGRSTGPHLHYEVHKGGVPINPAGMNLRTGQTLAGRDLQNFRQMVAKMDLHIAAQRPKKAPLLAQNLAAGSQN